MKSYNAAYTQDVQDRDVARARKSYSPLASIAAIEMAQSHSKRHVANLNMQGGPA